MASVGDSGGQNQSFTNSRIYEGQENFLKDLYGQAQRTQRQQQNSGPIAQGFVDKYLPGAEAAQQELAGLNGYYSDIADGTNLGMQTFADLQQGGINPHLQGMVDDASFQITNNLQRKTLPSIRTGGNAANPYGGGGSRQGIAEGLAMSDANQQLSNTVSQLYGQAYDADQNRRSQAAGAYLNAGNAAVQGQSALSNALAQGAQGLINLGLSPQQQAWLPLINSKQIIGSPAILQSGFSTGSNAASNVGVL